VVKPVTRKVPSASVVTVRGTDRVLGAECCSWQLQHRRNKKYATLHHVGVRHLNAHSDICSGPTSRARRVRSQRLARDWADQLLKNCLPGGTSCGCGKQNVSCSWLLLARRATIFQTPFSKRICKREGWFDLCADRYPDLPQRLLERSQSRLVHCCARTSRSVTEAFKSLSFFAIC
jgi:hypothetical protein